MKITCTSVFCLALLAGCGGPDDAATNEPKAEPTMAEATVAQVADCNAPELTVPHGDPDLPAGLMPGGEDLRRLIAAFQLGYDAACRDETIGADGLKGVDGNTVEALTIHNAPNANVVSIYEDNGEVLLEAPLFSDAAGPITIPAAADITEAIYCYAVGATDAEVEATGRCLPD